MTKAPKILLSLSCLLAASTPLCLAADKAVPAKQIYVPASQIPRRYDSEMFYGTEAVPTTNKTSTLYKAPSTYGKTPSKTSSSASALSSASKPLPVKKVSKPTVYKKTTDPFVQQTGSQFQAELAIKHADALIAQGKLKDAQAVLMKVHRNFPQESKLKDKIAHVSVLRSHHYLKSGDHSEAASQSRMALAFDSNNEKAKDSLNQALKGMNVDPASSAARLKQGHTLFSQGKTLEAAIEYRAALHNPLQMDSHAEALVGLGNVAAHHKDLANAKANYEAALHQNPNSSTALRQYGIFQFKQNELINANRNLSKALIVNPADAAAKEKLIELWQQQIAVRPDDAVTHLGMARAYQLAGDLKSAQAEYKTVVKIDPNHPNLPQARESFKIALIEQEARKHLESAHTLENHNALHEALAKASEAARITPNNVQTKLYQAHLAERIGNYKDAKAFYLSALTLDPNNTTASVGVRKYANILATGEHPIELKAQAGDMNGGASDSFDSFNSPRRIEGPRNWSFGVPPNAPPRFTGTEEPPSATLPAFPMTMQGAPATGASPAQYGVVPGSIYQVPSGDPLTNMAGFMGQLRGHMMSEKQKWKEWEDQVHDNMKPQAASAAAPAAASSSPSSIASLLGASPSTTAPAAVSTAATSPTGSKLITSGDVAALLQSLKKGKTPTAPVVATAAAPTLTQSADKVALPPPVSQVASQAAAATSTPPVAPPIQSQSKLTSVVNALSNAAAGRPLLSQPYNYNGYPTAYGNPFVNQIPYVNPYAPYNPQSIPAATNQITVQGPPQIDPTTGKALPTNLTQPQVASTVNNTTNWAALAATAGQVAYQNRGAIKAAAMNAAQKMQPIVENVKQSLTQANTSTVSETTKAKLLPTTTNETATASSTTTTSTQTVSTMDALNQAAVPAEITPTITKTSDENAIALAAPDSLTSESSSGLQANNLTKQTPKYATADAGSDKIAALENQNSELRQQLEKAQAQLKNRAYKSPFNQGGVRLELLGVSSTEKITTLNVLLKNDQDSQMKLPSSMRAVVRLIGTPDQVAKVKFDKKSLNANETVKGTITVHAPKLSPAADVLIPDLLGTSDGSKQDLHLTVPISSNFGVNK